MSRECTCDICGASYIPALSKEGAWCDSCNEKHPLYRLRRLSKLLSCPQPPSVQAEIDSGAYVPIDLKHIVANTGEGSEFSKAQRRYEKRRDRANALRQRRQATKA